MYVYAHRMEATLCDMVAGMGLRLTLSDTNSAISLSDNEDLLRELAARLELTLQKDVVEGSVFFTFQKKKT